MMTIVAVASSLGAVVAAIAAIVSAVIANRAHSTSASANTTAKDANSIARGARTAAQESNAIAEKANELSNQAIQDAREAQLDVIWQDIIRSVNTFLNINPVTEDIGNAFSELRLSEMQLIDKLDWQGLDTWLAAENGLAATIARDCRERWNREKPQTAEAAVEVTKHMSDWAVAYLNNLRLLRGNGLTSELADQMSRVTQHAIDSRQEIYNRNGWGTPPTEIDGVEPLKPN